MENMIECKLSIYAERLKVYEYNRSVYIAESELPYLIADLKAFKHCAKFYLVTIEDRFFKELCIVSKIFL